MPRRFVQLALPTVCSIALAGAASPAFPQAVEAPGGAAFTEGRFAEAASAAEEAVAKDSNSAAALADLARIRLYQHRESEAAELAHKADALAPGSPIVAQVLAIAQVRAKAFASDSYQIENPTAVGTAQFVATDPLPVLQVTIGGRQANFLLDTGGPDIVLTQAFAETLGLPLTDAGVGVFAGGRQARVQRTVVPELEIGGVKIRNVPAGVNAGLQFPNIQIDGIVGTGLLMHFLSTIDYCSGKLVLAPRSTSADFEQRAAAARANVVPIWLVGDHFIFARGKIDQAEGLFHIDTGLAGGGLTATKDMLDAAGIVPDESKAATGIGGGGAVRIVPFRASATLGTLTREDVRGVYSPGGNPYGMFPFKVAGAISHSFFRQSRLTLDFDAMKLVTEGC
jgi:hypothetical protein